MASGKISVSDSQLEATKKSVTKLQQQITAAADALELERRKSSVSNKYWNKVEDARKYFLVSVIDCVWTYYIFQIYFM